MGFLDKIKDIVMEPEAGEGEMKQGGNGASKGTASVSPPLSLPVFQQPPSYRVSVSTASADPTSLARIEKVAEAAPQRSYTEFRGFLEALAVALPDERGRYIAALLSAAHKGFPANDVLSGLDVIVKAIDDHRAQFQRLVPEQLEKTVGARRREISAIDSDIAAKRQQIDALNREIGVLTADRQTKETEIVSEERKIKDTEQKVLTAVEQVRSQYLAERDRVASYSGVGQPARTS